MRLDINKIAELKNEFDAIEKKMDRMYRDAWLQHISTFDKKFTDQIDPMMDRQKEIEDEILLIKATNVDVGDGISISPYSDWDAYTVIARRDTPKGFVLTCQEDKAIRTDHNGMSEAQSYEYERNENGRTVEIKWNARKQWFTYDCYRIAMGRHAYYDYSF